jgi:uncharacterized iron-regulated protein
MDIYVLGEVHDNPAHHAEQARLMALIAPQTVVWEMLSLEQVTAMGAVDRTDAAALEQALAWGASGWPDFAMYHPIFLAAVAARHQGAHAPRDALTQVMQGGLEAVLTNEDIARWGLGALPAKDQAAREAEQMAAHCNALPPELLPGMVDAQRLRDWYLSSAAVQAVEKGEGPVVVITGTGHARKDTGVPALIAAARPDLAVWSLGQTETGADVDTAAFDAVIVTPPTPRKDPCLAFKSSG